MAVEQIKMPQLGESVTEGTISKWLVSVGDKVNKYDPLAEVMTDKVNAEIPSSFSGVVKELIASEGETLSVGEVICTIDAAGPVSDEMPVVENPLVTNRTEQVPAVNQNTSRARFSPAVLKISQEHRIDLSRVQGTGAGGRITRKDLLALVHSGEIPQIEDKKEAPAQTGEQRSTNLADVPKALTSEPDHIGSSVGLKSGDIEIPVIGVRKAIAANMVRSKHEAPHAWMMVEVDATNLVEYRNTIKDDFKKNEGFNLTFFAFFVKAAAQALKEFPQLNSMWAGDKIIQKKDINISIAVATEDALYVPVIKNADEKSIKGIAREISELAGKARAGKLKTDDITGGTFTVNNTGSFGSVQSMGIINYPQAAILQVESIVKRAVVINNNMIAIRDMVNLCMSLDHRIIDGLVCGRFMKRLKEIIETTSESTTPIY
ncbi:dihydrolipoamide acetyltransferase family protein [Bacillus sp. EB600]|uniref:dihydrolipoamide acetyltransferase family protein n=1 Tax=Bacillus sp. EB600 TaxID=2806345 RepID=UPI00210E255F|nr:dihydrolipoamide acetyltransferase family protein [Bacillus sp. EB600]MCQ6278021.1 2-oxo acid dehydrogenase subunit E2 [Bacillus sp. EB600]